MKSAKKIALSYLFYCLSAFGVSLGIIAGVGVSSFNAMILALSTVSHVKIGTITIIINILLLMTFILVTHFKYPYKYLIQGVSVLFFGTLINFYVYNVLSGLTDLVYFERLLLIISGTIIGGSSTGIIIHYNVLTFPLENLCIYISKKASLSFTTIRYLADVFFILFSLTLSFTQHLPYFVREGTIISMLLLSVSMGTSQKVYKKLLNPLSSKKAQKIAS